MKKASILGLSSNHKLIVLFQQGQTYTQTKFQGFNIQEDVEFRPYFDELLNKEIQCTYNKNDKTLRYQNQSFFIKLVQNSALTVNTKQLEQSKIFSQEQKTLFSQMTTAENLISNSTITVVDLNDKLNSSVLSKFIKEKTNLTGRIEYLSDSMLIRFNHNEHVTFLRCKLNNFKHYFQLFSQVTMWKTKLIPAQVEFKVVAKKFNLQNNVIDVFVEISQKVSEKMLEEGFVALNQKTYHQNSKDSFKKLAEIENITIKGYKGIYSSKSQILSFIYAKNNYVGIVTKIIEGYIYEITSIKTQQTGKVELPTVVCPIGQDAGSYECRQFARKQLIGKQVNVYLQKEQGLNTTGNIIRIEDWKDIESILLQNGAAVVKQQLKNSIIGQKYSVIQTKAKQKKKGLHKKDLGNKRCQDLSQSLLNKSQLNIYFSRRTQLLNQVTQNQQVVIEDIISSLVYKVRIQSLQVLINVKLEGIIQPLINPNLKQYNEVRLQTEKFLKNSFLQRNMVARISDYDDQTNSYNGVLYFQKLKEEIQQILIKNCLVYADKYNFIPKYNQLEKQAKKTQILIWKPHLRCFEPGHQLDKQKYCFEGRFSWIKNGKVAFIHPKDNFESLQKIQNKIRSINLQKMPKDKQRIGAWCAAPYQGDFYRALITKKKDHNCTVQFFDWGNEQIVKCEQLRQLPEQLLYTQKQCIRVNLNLVARTRNKEVIQRVRQHLFQGGVYVFKKVHGDFVDFYSTEISSVNQQLIYKGFLRADKYELKRYDNRQLIRVAQQDLRKQRIGVWDQSEQSSEQQTQNY